MASLRDILQDDNTLQECLFCEKLFSNCKVYNHHLKQHFIKLLPDPYKCFEDSKKEECDSLSLEDISEDDIKWDIVKQEVIEEESFTEEDNLNFAFSVSVNDQSSIERSSTPNSAKKRKAGSDENSPPQRKRPKPPLPNQLAIPAITNVSYKSTSDAVTNSKCIPLLGDLPPTPDTPGDTCVTVATSVVSSVPPSSRPVVSNAPIHVPQQPTNAKPREIGTHAAATTNPSFSRPTAPRPRFNPRSSNLEPLGQASARQGLLQGPRRLLRPIYPNARPNGLLRLANGPNPNHQLLNSFPRRTPGSLLSLTFQPWENNTFRQPHPFQGGPHHFPFETSHTWRHRF